jgi:hypothetical protein
MKKVGNNHMRNMSPKLNKATGNQNDASTPSDQNMTLDTQRLIPFLDGESITTGDSNDYECELDKSTQIVKRQLAGSSLAFNATQQQIEYFSDKEKTELVGSYLLSFKDASNSDISIARIKVGENDINFLAENSRPNTVFANKEVKVKINAFATKINNLPYPSSDYGLQALNNDDGKPVNPNEYRLQGRIKKILGAPYFENSCFTKYLVTVNLRGCYIDVPVLFHKNVKKKDLEFKENDPIDINVNLHGEWI